MAPLRGWWRAASLVRARSCSHWKAISPLTLAAAAAAGSSAMRLCGKLLACMPSGDPARRGQAPVMITIPPSSRPVDRAENREIITATANAMPIDDLPNRSIVAHFADGSAAEGDFIVGADGIRSRVRQAVMPEAPKPVYTGLMAPGGFSSCIGDASSGPRSKQRTHFVFGQNGFFGYFNAVTPAGLRVIVVSPYRTGYSGYKVE